MYGICNLSLKSFTPSKRGLVENLVFKDSNKCYLLICLYLFVFFFRSVIFVQLMILPY